MPNLPSPTTDPEAFLAALLAQPDPAAAARGAGCAVHPLGTADAATAALHAAGARALAASLARGAAPMLLCATRPDDGYAPALTEGLMAYERIHTAFAPALALILILPPSQPNRYWQR